MSFFQFLTSEGRAFITVVGTRNFKKITHPYFLAVVDSSLRYGGGAAAGGGKVPNLDPTQ